jgi:hypothetical protein
LSGTSDDFDHHNEETSPHSERAVDLEQENESEQRRDQIAQAMWDNYLQVCAEQDDLGDGTTSEELEELTD